MISEEVKEIITGLLKKSRAGQVNWCPADDLGLESGLSDDFAVSLPDHSLNIYQPSGPGGKIVFAILDDSGKSVYSLIQEPSDPSYSEFAELLDLAKFKARRVGEVLDHIMRSLDTEEIIGLTPEEKEEKEMEIPF